MNKQNEFSREELLSCARGEMFGAGNAQLPMPGMLMVDRITQISKEGGLYGKGQVVAEQDIHPDLWFFHCHFLGDPIMPGSLCIEGMLQLVGFFWGGLVIRGVAAPWALARCVLPDRFDPLPKRLPTIST